jgi:hypothetical protein
MSFQPSEHGVQWRRRTDVSRVCSRAAMRADGEMHGCVCVCGCVVSHDLFFFLNFRHGLETERIGACVGDAAAACERKQPERLCPSWRLLATSGFAVSSLSLVVAAPRPHGVRELGVSGSGQVQKRHTHPHRLLARCYTCIFLLFLRLLRCACLRLSIFSNPSVKRKVQISLSNLIKSV